MTAANHISHLHKHLDELWTAYLQALDAYTAGRQVLDKSLAIGYFNLAQANARRTSGRRYGSDWYDERTKATARAGIVIENTKSIGASDLNAILSIEEVPVFLEPREPLLDNGQTASSLQAFLSQAGVNSTKATSTAQEKQTLPLPTPPSSPEPNDQDASTVLEKSQTDSGNASERKLQPDPVSWYGLFATPSLRAAQSAFKKVIYGDEGQTEAAESENPAATGARSALVNTINAARTMRQIEVEIRATRKAVRAATRKADA